MILPAMTDLDPYFSRIQSAFGRLIPTGVTGAESPTSPKTAMTLAEMPTTSFFLCASAMGE